MTQVIHKITSIRCLFALVLAAVYCGQLIPSTFAEEVQVSNSSNSELAVHSRYSKRYLLSISEDKEFRVIKKEGPWQIVRFNEPLLPLWLSNDYISINGETIVVNASRLNARLRPSLNAPVVTVLEAGSTLSMLERGDEFTAVLAPNTLEFAITRTDLNVEVDGKAGWVGLPGSVSRNKVTISNTEAAAESSSPIYTQPVNTSDNDNRKDVFSVSDNLDAEGQKIDNIETETQETLHAKKTEPDNGIKANSPLSSVQQTQQPTINYLISPGDVISLSVFGESDLSRDKVRVPQNGQVSFALIGTVKVTGKTTVQLEREIAAKFSKGYIRNPKVSITIDAYRPFFVKGAVKAEGSFAFTEGLTVSKALALSGGVTAAKENGVSIFRDDVVIASDLTIDSQVEIRPGDIISVEKEIGVNSEDQNFYVYLHGEVNNPGAYPFRKGLTVEKAVVLAGGFTLRASKRKISLTREIADQQEPEKMKKVKLFMAVQPNDIINVGASWF